MHIRLLLVIGVCLMFLGRSASAQQNPFGTMLQMMQQMQQQIEKGPPPLLDSRKRNNLSSGLSRQL